MSSTVSNLEEFGCCPVYGLSNVFNQCRPYQSHPNCPSCSKQCKLKKVISQGICYYIQRTNIVLEKNAKKLDFFE